MANDEGKMNDVTHSPQRASRIGEHVRTACGLLPSSRLRTFTGRSRLARAFGVASTRDGRAPRHVQATRQDAGSTRQVFATPNLS